MINANNDSYKYELLLAFVIDYCSYPFGDEVYSHKTGDHYKEIKEAVRKVLFMKGDLQIAPTTGPKTTDFK